MFLSENSKLLQLEGIYVLHYGLLDSDSTNPTPDGEPTPSEWLNWMGGLEKYVITTKTCYSRKSLIQIIYIVLIKMCDNFSPLEN
jgi:hypothetical protein